MSIVLTFSTNLSNNVIYRIRQADNNYLLKLREQATESILSPALLVDSRHV